MQVDRRERLMMHNRFHDVSSFLVPHAPFFMLKDSPFSLMPTYCSRGQTV